MQWRYCDETTVDKEFEEVFTRNDQIEVLLTDIKQMDFKLVQRFRRSHMSLMEFFKLTLFDPTDVKSVFENKFLRAKERKMKECDCLYHMFKSGFHWFFADNTCFRCNEFFQILEQRPINFNHRLIPRQGDEEFFYFDNDYIYNLCLTC